MVKRKTRIWTLDGRSSEEFEVDIPTEEEKKEEFERLYPDKSKATYLQYPCHYCGNKFYLENRDRVLNMIPLREGYICIYLEKYHKYYEGGENDKDLGRLIPVCSSCFKVMTDEGERISIKPSNPVTHRRLVK